MSEKVDFAAHLQKVLQGWSETPEEQPLEQFLSGIVGEERTSTILETLAGIDAAHKEVQLARDSGRTRSAWLGDVLKQELPGEAWGDFLDSSILSVADLSKSAPHSAVAASFVELGNGALSVTEDILTEALPFEADVTTLQEVVDFFQSPLGSDVEWPVKAVASAATINYLDGTESQVTAPAVVAAVDLGLEIAKVGYKVSVGDESLSKGMERIQDRAVAAAASVIRRVAPVVGEKVGHAVGSALGGFIGMAPAGAIVGRAVGRMAGEYIAKHAESGVKTVVKAVKAVAKKVKQAASSVWSAAKSFVGGLFGA